MDFKLFSIFSQNKIIVCNRVHVQCTLVVV